jgi:hypothetical protein
MGAIRDRMPEEIELRSCPRPEPASTIRAMVPSSNCRTAAVMSAVLVLGACGLRTPLTDTDPDPGHTCPSGCPDELSESCAAGNDLSAALNEGVRFVGQIYTAGRTGTLSGVNVDVRPTSVSRFDLRVAIRQVVGGFPTQVILGSTTLATSDSPFDSLVQFSPPIQQVTGQQYAIVVDYPDDPAIGDMQGMWEGTTSIDCYAGGKQVGSVDGINWGRADGTLHFRVFIKTR